MIAQSMSSQLGSNRSRFAGAGASVPAQADIVGGDARPLTDAGGEATAQKSLFLRKVHESACGIFTTVLGPEANEAHRNHLHLDLAQRRSSAFCE